MNVTRVRLFPYQSNTNTTFKGSATVTIDDAFVIHNIAIIEGKRGRFIGFPDKRDKSGKFVNVVHPCTKEARAVISDAILAEYEKRFPSDDVVAEGRYNPFNGIEEEHDIELLVSSIMRNTASSDQEDSFWEQSEEALLTALFAYLYYHANKNDQNIANVVKLLNAAYDPDDEDGQYKTPLDYIFEEVENKVGESFATRKYKAVRAACPGKTMKDIATVCVSRLQQLDPECFEKADAV